MSAPGQNPASARACARCLRRSWLLDALGGPLDCVSGDSTRLIDSLALEDDALLRAFAGRRRTQLSAQYEQFSVHAEISRDTEDAVCPHSEQYPCALRFRFAPRAVYVAPTARRLADLTSAPVVAVSGTSRASDYGIGVTRGLARGLAAAGVTVAAQLRDGIAAAALAGALEGGGRAVCALASGVNVAPPGRRRSLHTDVLRAGCTVSELPHGAPARRWSQLASSRLLVGLAQLTLIVEAENNPRDLMPASLARMLGRRLGAVPGRVTSPASQGTNALLARGATVISGADDVLELISAAAAGHSARQPSDARDALAPRLRRVLERVGDGCDTPERLRHEVADVHSLLQALGELELMGLLVRGDGGRYLPAPGPAA